MRTPNCRWLGKTSTMVLSWAASVIAGPLTYLAGARLGAAELGTGTVSAFAAFGISWAVLVPILLVVAARTRTWTTGHPIPGTPT